MPRTLPWEKKGGSSATRPKRPAATKVVTEKKKKARGTASDSDGDDENKTNHLRKELTIDAGVPTSSSPPPEPAPESFMKEGLDQDDKFRMVEDEFLAVAQKFTVHLHAAEYKRQQKMVKNRNAETINSISRPVTGKMPDTTKHKIEAMARTKTQRAAIENLLGKKRENGEMSDDSDDEGALPYFGTTLHGLMDSPRRKAVSIAKPGTITATTRAAAGFEKPTIQTKTARKSMLGSPKPKSMARSTQAAPAKHIADETSDDDEDDDLDAPIQAPKRLHDRRPSQLAPINSKDSLPLKTKFPTSKKASSSPTASVKKEASTLSFDDIPSFLTTQGTPRMSRFERARQQKAKQEKEEETKTKLGDIPSFF